MDNTKMIETPLAQLKHFLTNELHVDIPLFWNNPNNCIRICFEDMDRAKSKEVANEVIEHLFAGSKFWLCEYGSISGNTIKQNNLVKAIPDILVMPYHSEIVDTEWFEYDYDAISCTLTCLNEFNVGAYIDYCFRLDFLSNSLYLADLTRKCVVAIYDRRGMDIASTNIAILQQLSEKHIDYIIPQSD